MTNTSQAGYPNDNHVTDWRENLGMSECGLCVKPANNNLGTSLLWTDLRVDSMADAFK